MNNSVIATNIDVEHAINYLLNNFPEEGALETSVSVGGQTRTHQPFSNNFNRPRSNPLDEVD